MPNTLRIAVLISGGGSTLQNLIELVNSGELPVQIVKVISSNPNARGIEFASQASIPHDTVQRKLFDDDASFSEDIFSKIREAKAELVVCGGFLKKLVIPGDFTNRVINVHPSLIPAFCGKGFYGKHVHEAVVEYGCRLSGCTIHFVDNEYDHGPIIHQATVDVSSNDSAETLAGKVQQLERSEYPKIIGKIAQGKVTVECRKVIVAE